METGKVTIVVAVITIVGGWGTALITNWDALFGADLEKPPSVQDNSPKELSMKLELKEKELATLKSELEKEKDRTAEEKNRNSLQQEILDQKNREIENIKRPFNMISNSKLKQLLVFHNDAMCYGRSMNFTHNPGPAYNHCVSKKILAERFLKFFEELELIDENGGTDYSQKRAKQELIKLQTNYKFQNPGWYTEYMLGILIIEYAKKG